MSSRTESSPWKTQYGIQLVAMGRLYQLHIQWRFSTSRICGHVWALLSVHWHLKVKYVNVLKERLNDCFDYNYTQGCQKKVWIQASIILIILAYKIFTKTTIVWTKSSSWIFLKSNVTLAMHTCKAYFGLSTKVSNLLEFISFFLINIFTSCLGNQGSNKMYPTKISQNEFLFNSKILKSVPKVSKCLPTYRFF